MNYLVNSIVPHRSETAERAFTQFLLEALPSPALIVDPQGRIAALNLQAEMVLGCAAPTLERLIAHEILECRAEDTADASENCPIASALRGGSVLPTGQMLIRCGDDSFRPIEYKCIPYPTLAGVGAILAFRDLSHEIELEKDLNRLASIAEESPIAIVELNEDANLLYANPAMMSLVERFGFSSEARPLILPANIAKLAADCLQTQKDIGGIDVSVAGTHYEWKLVPVAHEKLVRGHGIDLTARKRAEIEITQAKAKTEVASQAKSKFLANMSDEIRTPIHDIVKQADLLVESGLNNQQLDYAKALKLSSATLMTSIDDILAIAALETGKISVETVPVNFRTFMAKTIDTFIRRAEDKGLQLTVTIGNQVPAQVSCDASRLGQLLHNLLSDAIKFIDRGEVVVEVDRDTIGRATATEENANNFYLFFTICNRGISQEKWEAVFDGFNQPGSSMNPCLERPGLGLALSKQLVELMGGTIGVETDSGKRGKLWFSLPMRQVRRGTVENDDRKNTHRAVI
jgi:two-component system, sensor histidine kinase and response regulator